MADDLIDAMLTIHYHTGQWSRVGGVGTHGGPIPVVHIGSHQFRIGRDEWRIKAWAAALRDRVPNAPLPEPPE